MPKLNLKSVWTLIGGFFLIRLYGIWFPPLETWHSWRQTLTNMMARNMPENGYSLFYPMVDMGGERTGIIGSEFPLFQLLIAVFNGAFGYDHWYGRLINLVVSSIAVWCFFEIIKRIWNERTAWYATVIFLSSLWFSFSRKAMPDTFAVSLVIIGIYLAKCYIDSRKITFLFLTGIFLMLGGLCKIPAVFLFALFIPVVLHRNILLTTKINLGIILLISSITVLWWYFYWVPYLVHTYHFELFFPKGIAEGLKEIAPYWADFWKQFYFGALRSWVVLLPFTLGVVWLFRKNNRRVALGFLTLTLIFILFAIKTGTVFPTHNYYVLPFVPVMAVLAAVGLQQLDPKWAFILLLIIAIEGVGNQISDFRIKDEVKYRVTLEDQLNSVIPKGEKVVVFTGSDPQLMYWLNRKGWSLDEGAEKNKDLLKEISEEGGKYLVTDKSQYDLVGMKVYKETEDCRIYKNPE
jgi:4-amino-4-deoxy-L-arabinose transferase-like glycosyltransferase